MRLRYTGALPVSFVTLGIAVDPGTEFEVPDEDALSLLARADVEEVQAPPARRKAAKSAAPADEPAGAAPAPVTEEVDSAVPDDH